jgi:hypothetical protein
MDFNSHSDLVGKHAFLSASKYHWINYDLEKLDAVFRNSIAAQRGTELHEFAHNAIRLGIKLPRTPKTLNMYVNDAIGFRMNTEQILFVSDNCYGTADAISYKKGVLRVHDLKTGEIPGSPHQLEVYVAMFCLEYGVKPTELEIYLRIYQDDEIREYVPDAVTIVEIMGKIIAFDKHIQLIQTEL